MRYESVLDGTRVNAVGDGELIVCVRDETLAVKYARFGWTSFADQVNAGYPFYLEPTELTASYSEDFDIGRLVVRAKAIVTFDWQKADGDILVTLNIQKAPTEVELHTVDDEWITTVDDEGIIVDSYEFADSAAGTYGFIQDVENFTKLRLNFDFKGANNKSLFKLKNLALTLQEF